MRILIIGGTAFVGRHITQSALDGGHHVALFNRGRTGAALFPQAQHLAGDRNGDLSALAGGSWDATIDVCAYFPRQVRSLAAALGGRGGRYVFISSVSAYSPAVPPNYDESAPLAEVGDIAATQVTNENYGGLKVACEQVSTELFGPGITIVRPTYVIGPYDRSYRFTWWVQRLASGGNVLAPGDPDDPIQLIDARDMAAWIVSLLEHGIAGTFHAVSPAPPFGFGQMLAAIADAVAPRGTQLTWVPSDFLLGQGVDGEALPLWPEGEGDDANMSRANPAAAEATGLAPRPLQATVADIAAELRANGGGPPGIGLTPEREAELLARWQVASR
ncbi:MAG: NAD-dependent epimerase/dehydratase family protein [Streptosporangiaceae bacterium]